MNLSLALVCEICLVGLALSLGLTLLRILKGPTVADRVASLDLTSAIVILTLGVWSVKTSDPAYLDVAVVLAIVTFLSSVSFARYLERRAERESTGSES